ncbi:RecQ family helicase MusN [Aspergillus luchuensis]|uniref:RecQ family helicase MusN n=1 Tax=Aspergillus kawachii TaxID=1069201 RepID=A0A146FNN6_ASPKA|nr:RecQ family helicase MusN [Aspergillus luchuensis]
MLELPRYKNKGTPLLTNWADTFVSLIATRTAIEL